MSSVPKWRLLLKHIVQDPQERQRLTAVVSLVTLNRWITGESRPRPQNLRQLVLALPGYREELISALKEEFQDFSLESNLLQVIVASNEYEIPSGFYTRVIHDRCYLPKSLRFTALSDFILQQALSQLDPQRVGVELSLAVCMPPSGNAIQKVRSLRESIGRGTPPWNRELGQRTLFLGNESLAGYALTTGHFRVIQNREEGHHLFPAHWIEGEESAMACPILNDTGVAGCLIVSSVQPDYFSSHRQTLIQHFAELLALAFHEEQFYELSTIALAVMPAHDVQVSFLATFRQRAAHAMIEGAKRHEHLNLLQAENLVWSQIEAELIHWPHSPGASV